MIFLLVISHFPFEKKEVFYSVATTGTFLHRQLRVRSRIFFLSSSCASSSDYDSDHKLGFAASLATEAAPAHPPRALPPLPFPPTRASRERIVLGVLCMEPRPAT